MFWSSEPDEEEEALLCSPALMARRASESWIVAPPVENKMFPSRQRFNHQSFSNLGLMLANLSNRKIIPFYLPATHDTVKAMPVAPTSLQRKKSLPDVAQPIQLTATAPLSREEVSVLSSMRREEIRRQIGERERLRANPLLYLVSPQVKDWFSRQQLVMLVLFINISLALMFFKLLT